MIGAVLLGTAQQMVTVTISSELNVLIVGVLLVIFVIAGAAAASRPVRSLRRGGEPWLSRVLRSRP